MLTGSRKQQRVAMQSLIFQAAEGQADARLILADHIYKTHGTLHAVIHNFQRWRIPCPDHESWGIPALKKLMCLKKQITFMPLAKDKQGTLALPSRYTGSKKQFLALPAQVDAQQTMNPDGHTEIRASVGLEQACSSLPTSKGVS